MTISDKYFLKVSMMSMLKYTVERARVEGKRPLRKLSEQTPDVF